MADELQVQVELDKVLANVDRYVAELGMDGPTVVKDQTRLLIAQLVKHATPPDSLSGGRVAIMTDMRKVFFPIDVATFRIVTDRKGIVRILPRDGKGNRRVADVSPDLTMASLGMMKSIHEARLNARGRVRGEGIRPLSKKPVTFAQSDMRRMAIVRMSDFRKYRAGLFARVGKAKAGWIPSLDAVGGKGLPSWVERSHPGKDREGSVRDVALGAAEYDPRITIVNAARGMSGLRPAVLATSLRYRAAAMEKHIRVLLALRAREQGLSE